MDGKREMFIKQNSEDFSQIKIGSAIKKRSTFFARNLYFTLFCSEQSPTNVLYKLVDPKNMIKLHAPAKPMEKIKRISTNSHLIFIYCISHV